MRSEASESFLSRCSSEYEARVVAARRGRSRGEPNATLAAVRDTAKYAWFHHPGRFADGALEDLALDIGQRLDDIRPAVGTDRVYGDDRPQILHATTRVSRIGGHTRAISNWVRADPARRYTVAIMDQGEEPPRPELEESLAECGGELLLCPHEGLVEQARWLRDLSASGFELVILHHFPSDPVPVVAFATPTGPPVVVLNHADHVFWLGSSVADAVVSIRPLAHRLAESRRFARRQAILPTPMQDRRPDISRQDARIRLELPADAPMLLTIGSGYKYSPTATHDFFRAAAAILEKVPQAEVHMIGLMDTELATFPVDRLHPRLHVHGIIPQPTLWQVAADIALDSFPFGSTTALLESVVLGAFPALGPAPRSLVLVTESPPLKKHLEYPVTEEAYVEGVVDAIDAVRIGQTKWPQIRHDVLDYHSGEGWVSRLEDVYRRFRGCAHAPRRIPHTSSECTVEDAAVSSFHQALPEWVS